MGWGSAAEQTHPWERTASDPRYFFDGMDTSNPPVMQWKRTPAANAALTITILGRPYFDTLASGTYTELPTVVVPAIRHHLRLLWAAFEKDYEAAQFEAGLREDAVATAQINDNNEGAHEGSRVVGLPADFHSEMGGP